MEWHLWQFVGQVLQHVSHFQDKQPEPKHHSLPPPEHHNFSKSKIQSSMHGRFHNTPKISLYRPLTAMV